jgi:hypothetical protein
MACGDGGSATAEWREPTSSDQLPIHRSESPTGYSSAGCSPAQPASASPVTDNSTPNPIQLANQMRCSTSLRDAGKLTLLVPLPSARAGCHLYFARRVTFLSCTDMSGFALIDFRENSWPSPDQWVTPPPVRYARNSPSKTAARHDDGYCAGSSVGAAAFVTGGGVHLPVSASLFGA